MTIKIGDKVRFLNEKGEGTVTKIINKTTIGVTIEDGFELPFLIAQVVIISDEIEVSTTSGTINTPVIPARTTISKLDKKSGNGIYFAITPEKENDISNSDFNCWLINETTYTITFSFSIMKPDGFETLAVLSLNAFQTQLIETVDKKELDEFTNIKLDVLFHNKKVHAYQTPISEFIKLKAVKLYKENTFIENNFLTEKAFVIPVFEVDKEKAEVEKEIITPVDFSKLLLQKQFHSAQAPKSKPNNNRKELEIDLHIEELLDDYSGMTNGQIIQVQLNQFQKVLNRAIDNKYQRLVVIHGVGNGKLKQEVRAILSSYNMQYYDASYAKYGYGATEVIISS